MLGGTQEKYRKKMLEELLEKLRNKLSHEEQNQIVNETRELLEKISKENYSFAEYLLKEIQANYGKSIPAFNNIKF